MIWNIYITELRKYLGENHSDSTPSVLVTHTNNTSQSYIEAEELLTIDEIMACETENFVEHRDELREKAMMLRKARKEA